MLDKFSEAIRGNLTKLERMKLVSLVTIEVRDPHILVHAIILCIHLLRTCTCTLQLFMLP